MKTISLIVLLGIIFFAYKSCAETPKDKFVSISTTMCTNQVPKKYASVLQKKLQTI